MYSLDWSSQSALAPACALCTHGAASHIHGSPLSCAHCALGPLAHAMGIGCSLYTPRTWAHPGESCREPGCACGGYSAAAVVGGQELLGGDGRQ